LAVDTVVIIKLILHLVALAVVQVVILLKLAGLEHLDKVMLAAIVMVLRLEEAVARGLLELPAQVLTAVLAGLGQLCRLRWEEALTLAAAAAAQMIDYFKGLAGVVLVVRQLVGVAAVQQMTLQKTDFRLLQILHLAAVAALKILVLAVTEVQA
jgi:hypothetical protein